MAKRTVPIEDKKPESNSAIFGGAKPVDTSAKEREIEEKLQKQNRSRTTSERSSDDPEKPVKSIFGGAKPVDTTKREREIEEKLRKTSVSEDHPPEKNSNHKNQTKTEKSKVRSPPAMKKAEESEPPVSLAFLNHSTEFEYSHLLIFISPEFRWIKQVRIFARRRRRGRKRKRRFRLSSIFSRAHRSKNLQRVKIVKIMKEFDFAKRFGRG